jgi:hypothetical protein
MQGEQGNIIMQYRNSHMQKKWKSKLQDEQNYGGRRGGTYFFFNTGLKTKTKNNVS